MAVSGDPKRSIWEARCIQDSETPWYEGSGDEDREFAMSNRV